MTYTVKEFIDFTENHPKSATRTGGILVIEVDNQPTQIYMPIYMMNEKKETDIQMSWADLAVLAKEKDVRIVWAPKNNIGV